MFLRQLRAVAMKEQRRDRDVSNGVYLQLATELLQDTIGIRQPILHSSRYRQDTIPGVPECSGLFKNLVHHNGKKTVYAHHQKYMPLIRPTG